MLRCLHPASSKILSLSLTGFQKYLKWYVFCKGADPGAEHLEWRLSVHLRPPPSTSFHCLSTLAFSASHQLLCRVPPHHHSIPLLLSAWPSHGNLHPRQSTYMAPPQFAFFQIAVKSYGAWQRQLNVTVLKGRRLKFRRRSFFFLFFFKKNKPKKTIKQTTSGCPLLRKRHLMDRQAAINTLHFSLRLCSHFHFDVIIISFLLIVTGLWASIFTHWLHGKKRE